MAEHPILFSDEMVRAILAGRKVQTRRPHKWLTAIDYHQSGGDALTGEFLSNCPFGVPGDLLWVREAHAIESNRGLGQYVPPFNDGRPLRWVDDPDYGQYWEQCHYRATDPAPELAYPDNDGTAVRWRPSIHMPRWASRITLTVTDVRVERVQDISAADVKEEGIRELPLQEGEAGAWWTANPRAGVSMHGRTPVAAYAKLWDAIYAKRGLGWDANPWLWCVTFRHEVA